MKAYEWHVQGLSGGRSEHNPKSATVVEEGRGGNSGEEKES